MTPQEHYLKAEEFAIKGATAGGAASDAGLKFAVLAVAHALLAHPPSDTGSSPTSGPILPRKLKPV